MLEIGKMINLMEEEFYIMKIKLIFKEALTIQILISYLMNGPCIKEVLQMMLNKAMEFYF